MIGKEFLNMEQTYFNPGCALSLYKPDMEERILAYLNQHYRPTLLHKICCHHEPCVPDGSVIINVCAGCDRRFRKLYGGIDTISLWEVLDGIADFPFPDYHGAKMSIQDPCPVRDRPAVHAAVRSLLGKMHIELVEPRLHSENTVCCGDVFHKVIPPGEVQAQMARRAGDMPCKEVVVYCVSCIKALYIGGKTPRHLVDLLFDEATDPQEYHTDKWHDQIDAYIEMH